MKLLLDTHAFLWWVADDERLSGRARRAIADPGNEVSFSAVSAWEIVVKAGLGRLGLPESAERFVPEHLEANGFSVLPLHLRHALRVARLPEIHRDPFDRLLVAQALAERLALVSGDEQIRRYRVRLVW
ncbi:MAG: type II toxin-antitoxin system VapC family toxin [Actinomycetota bacterium]